MTGADVIAILGAVRKQAEVLQGAVPLEAITPCMAARWAATCREAADTVAEYAANLEAVPADPTTREVPST